MNQVKFTTWLTGVRNIKAPAMPPSTNIHPPKHKNFKDRHSFILPQLFASVRRTFTATANTGTRVSTAPMALKLSIHVGKGEPGCTAPHEPNNPSVQKTKMPM